MELTTGALKGKASCVIGIRDDIEVNLAINLQQIYCSPGAANYQGTRFYGSGGDRRLLRVVQKRCTEEWYA